MRILLQRKQNYLAVSSVLILFLFLLAVDFYYTWEEHEAILKRDAKNGAIYTEETVQQILTVLSTLSKSPVLRSGDSKRISDFLNSVGDFPQVTSLELANAKGQRWTGKNRDIGTFFVTDREFYQGVVRTGKPYITNFNQSKLFDKIEFIVAYPIFNEQKKLENVFFAPVWNTTFEPVLRKVSLESGGNLSIVDSRGRLLISSEKEITELTVSDHPDKFSVDGGQFLAAVFKPKAILTAKQPISGTSWYVEVHNEVSEVLPKVIRKILIDLFVIILVLMPVSLVFMLFLGQIEKQRRELLRSNKKLQSLANTDGLTGLLNHRTFQDTLAQLIGEAGTESPLTLLMIDIDNFKIFNDQFGHQAGDKVLKQLGRMLKDFCGSSGIAARYGGEEFVVILPNTDHEAGMVWARKLASQIGSMPMKLDDDTEVRISASIGFASYPRDATDRQNLIKFADRALYKAKEKESNKIQMYYSVLEELRENIESDQDLIKIIRTLNTIINAKDKYTLGHSERVMHYAASLAKCLGLPSKDIEGITIGAFLHDIGKVEIPGDVLNKPGKLNSEEFEFIRKHPLIGAEIIRPIKSLEKARDFALYHHERFDGRGYPFGLEGSSIPLYGRIAAIVDAFDAMTTNRPYQKVKSNEEALDELKRNAGSQFDPEIVEKFIEMYLQDKIKEENSEHLMN